MSGGGLVLLLSGPNLNLLGEREPEIYGTATLDDHVAAPRRRPKRTASPSSTSSPTTRATWWRRSTAPAAGPWPSSSTPVRCPTTSWSLHDALAAFDGLVVELHLSNPAAREPFRHTSTIAPVADGCIAGFGGLGYPLAVEAVPRILAARRDRHRRRPCRRDWRSRWPRSSVAGRLDRLRAALAARDRARPARGAASSPRSANIRWLTGLHRLGRHARGGRRPALLATDGRYRTQAAEQLAAVRRRRRASSSPSAGSPPSVRRWRAPSAGAAAVGLEAGDVTWAAVRTWEEVLAPGAARRHPGARRGLRVVKDAGEIARMERAAAIADAALGAVLPLLPRGRHRRGLTESAFAAALDHAMRTPRRRGPGLRDHRRLGRELGQAPRPARHRG